MSAQMKPTLTERLKSLWDSYGIEVLKFGTVGGAAFIVNSVTVWVLMMTIMSESHTKAKVVASVVATIFSWLMNRLWTFRDSRSENWKREAIEFGLVNLLGILVEAGCVAFSTYVLNLRTPRRPSSPVRLSVPFWVPFFATSSTASGSTVRTARRLTKVKAPTTKSSAACLTKLPPFSTAKSLQHVRLPLKQPHPSRRRSPVRRTPRPRLTPTIS